MEESRVVPPYSIGLRLMTEEFYAGKNIIVFGGNGALGKYVCAGLRSVGAQVTAPRSEMIDLRISDPVLLRDIIRRFDMVFHLAGLTHGISSVSEFPVHYIRDNSLMALNLLDAMAPSPHIPLICAGSVCAYPQHTPIPMTEENLWKGKPEPTNFPYGEAKRLLLALCEAYHQEHGLSFAYLISANLYGPNDHFDDPKAHVIPSLITRMSKAKADGDPTFTVWGTGNASRDFLYFVDAAWAYILAGRALIRSPKRAIICNIGGGEEIRIAYVAEMIRKYLGYEGELIFDTSKPDGQDRRALRIWKAKNLIEWEPHILFDDGLRRTVASYRVGYHAKV